MAVGLTLPASVMKGGGEKGLLAGDAGACKIATSPAGRRTRAIVKLALFAVFVGTRALHPLLIDASKKDGKILYGKNTPVMLNKLLTIVLMNAVALLAGGVDGVRLCWQPKCLTVFGCIGVIYALGDFLEMLSMSALSGGVYQTLLQTKLLITALMLWWIKGTKQTQLQWHVLFAMFLAMSSFVIMDQDSHAGGQGRGPPPLGAVACVTLKVTVSCYCAVLSEKYLKEFEAMPLYAKISGISTTWAFISGLFCLTERNSMSGSFFAHWDETTWMVTASFILKTVVTMYLLQALDSVQKNIGEALAVLAIYLSQASKTGAFELSVFLVAALVVMLVKTYGISASKPKPALPTQRRVGCLVRPVSIVSLSTEGSPVMMKAGINTLRCEVGEELPDGVFYGLLGDVHPVCGSTDPSSRRNCELMLLSQPSPKNAPHLTIPMQAPYLPSESLTVLGHLHPSSPSEPLSPARYLLDAEQARHKFVALCTSSASCEGP